MELTGLKIIRPFNTAFIFLLVLFSHSLVVGYFDPNPKAILAALSISSIAAAGYSLNDYFDYKIDLKNKPKRPIPNKNISRKGALILSAALFFLGLLASVFVNFKVVMTATVAIISLLLYGIRGHNLGLSGDFLISFLTALVFIHGAFVATDNIPTSITIIATAAFTINMAREIVKDIEDYDADREYKLTLPQKLGKYNSAILAMLFLLSNLIITYILIPLYVTGIALLISLPLALFTLIKILRIVKSQDAKTAELSQKFMKILMVMEFVSVLLVKFVIGMDA